MKLTDSLIRIVLVSLLVVVGGRAVEAEEIYRYVVKGEIVKLPPTAESGAEIIIKHEEIPEYVNIHGKKVGMRAMTMPFWLGEGVSLEGLAVGDKIEFEFISKIKPRPDERVVSIKRLTNIASN